MSVSTVSLSKEILFGTFEKVMELINAGANVNEKDPYGFTPLIEATLKEDLEIAKVLLAHGAKVDQQDISGQTALQWAVNRCAVAFVELYLQSGANPNHYSADGEPVLVNPSLRNQTTLVQSLLEAGAAAWFSEDFIQAKLIGHRYELVGRAQILNTNGKFIDLNYEGFYLEFTVNIIFQSVVAFMNSEAGRFFNSYKTVVSKISRALKSSSDIIAYKYSVKKTADQIANIRRALNEDLVVIPVSYEGHAITFIKYGKLLAKCDRGVKHIVDTVVIYEVGNGLALNSDFLMDLMYTQKTADYINTDIKQILNLKPLTTLPARYQLSGNCSWANVEASVPAMMFMLMFRGNSESRGEIAALKKSIMEYYDVWMTWDKERILDHCIKTFHQANRERKVAKGSILAAILFQRCNPDRKNEVERAKKILSVLTVPGYQYLLKTYIDVYYTKAAGLVGENFIRLLKVCGLDLSTLTVHKGKI